MNRFQLIQSSAAALVAPLIPYNNQKYFKMLSSQKLKIDSIINELKENNKDLHTQETKWLDNGLLLIGNNCSNIIGIGENNYIQYCLALVNSYDFKYKGADYRLGVPICGKCMQSNKNPNILILSEKEYQVIT
jgi:hypothetical protein